VSTEDTRHRLLAAALTVISQHGLARLALEDVARAAGVSRQTVYRYVGSRGGLITATILTEERAFLERIRAAAAEQDDLRSALEQAAEAVRRLIISYAICPSSTPPDGLAGHLATLLVDGVMPRRPAPLV
jgi:AcrR family transcriptional regulator